MAQLALGIAGGAIGFAVGGPAGAQAGFALGSALGGQLFAPNLNGPNQVNEGARLNDLSLGGSSYGAQIPVVFGSMRVPGNIVWADDLTEIVHRDVQEVESGGKGGGGSSSQEVVNITYTYNATFAAVGSKGEIYGIRRIWLNKGLIFNLGNDASGSSVAQSNRLLANLRRYNGSLNQSIDPDIAADKGADALAYRDRAYLVLHDIDVTQRYGNRIPTVEMEIVENGELFGGNQIKRLNRSAAHIIQSLCESSGLVADDIDVTELTNEVAGYFAGQQTVAQKINPLLDAFFIDAVLSGNRLVFRPRETASVRTINESDLIAGDQSNPLSKAFADEVTLPKVVSVEYFDADRDYQKNTQTSTREVTRATNTLALTIPMAMTATQAKQIAEKTLLMVWTARLSFTFNLPYKHMDLEPGDVVTINTAVASHEIKITTITYGANYQLQCEGVAYDASVFTSDTEADTGEHQPLEIGDAGNAESYFVNLPPLVSSHNTYGYYAGATSSNSVWRSGNVFRSIDAGTTYSYQYTVAPYCLAGTVAQVIPDGQHHYWDNELEITVVLIRGELESLADQAILAGANAALIGNEIIQFSNAELIAENTYKLTRLLRGRRGTEWAKASHQADERFILLNTLRFVSRPLEERGVEHQYKTVSNGQIVADAPAFSFAVNNEILTPFSPVQAKGVRDGSNNLTITWRRRDRLGKALSGELTLSEAVESYEIDIISGGVVRTITAATTSATYTAAQQTADGLTPGNSVQMNIYQISATVGRGRALNATI